MKHIMNSYREELFADAKDIKTIESYQNIVFNFLNWYDSNELINVRPVDITEYLSELRHKRRLSPRTVNKYIAGLSSFFTFLHKKNYIKINPMARVRRVSVADSYSEESRWLTPTEQERFLTYAELETNEWLRIRNLAVIDLMLYAGLRVQEVADLMIDDVVVSGKDLKVTIRDGKKGKYAEVTLIQKYSRNLKKWFVVRAESKKPAHLESEQLFVSERSGKLTTRSIQKFITKYGELAAMKGVTPHRFRHSFCKNLARKDTPIEVIRRLARHEKIETTAIYIEPAGEELIEALKKM